MTRIEWNSTGDRTFHSGVDRGVLYPESGPGVAWNGLVGVDESPEGGDVESYYFDGVKYADSATKKEFRATLSAYTYPDEFEEIQGMASVIDGFMVDDQASKRFGLSYRTRIGNDLNGTDLGYKIHILYNQTAVANARNYDSLSNNISPTNFRWGLSGVPVHASGFVPSAHYVINSTKIDTDILNEIEAILYGTPTWAPRLPEVSEIIDFMTNWDPKLITPDSVGGLAVLNPGVGEFTPTTTEGIYRSLSTSRLLESETNGIYQLEE